MIFVRTNSSPLSSQEISDDLMFSLSSLMGSALPSEAVSAQQKAFVTYTFPNQQNGTSNPVESTVTLLEARSVISASGTTGLRTWEAALVLGSYLASHEGQSTIRGQKVIELGAGIGTLSILCAKCLEAAAVVATDGDEAVVDAVKTNAFLNQLDPDDPNETTFQAAVLRWGWPIDGTTFREDYGMDLPEVLLGADVVSTSSFLYPACLDCLLGIKLGRL